MSFDVEAQDSPPLISIFTHYALEHPSRNIATHLVSLLTLLFRNVLVSQFWKYWNSGILILCFDCSQPQVASDKFVNVEKGQEDNTQ